MKKLFSCCICGSPKKSSKKEKPSTPQIKKDVEISIEREQPEKSLKINDNNKAKKYELSKAVHGYNENCSISKQNTTNIPIKFENKQKNPQTESKTIVQNNQILIIREINNNTSKEIIQKETIKETNTVPVKKDEERKVKRYVKSRATNLNINKNEDAHERIISDETQTKVSECEANQTENLIKSNYENKEAVNEKFQHEVKKSVEKVESNVEDVGLNQEVKLTKEIAFSESSTQVNSKADVHKHDANFIKTVESSSKSDNISGISYGSVAKLSENFIKSEIIETKETKSLESQLFNQDNLETIKQKEEIFVDNKQENNEPKFQSENFRETKETQKSDTTNNEGTSKQNNLNEDHSKIDHHYVTQNKQITSDKTLFNEKTISKDLIDPDLEIKSNYVEKQVEVNTKEKASSFKIPDEKLTLEIEIAYEAVKQNSNNYKDINEENKDKEEVTNQNIMLEQKNGVHYIPIELVNSSQAKKEVQTTISVKDKLNKKQPSNLKLFLDQTDKSLEAKLTRINEKESILETKREELKILEIEKEPRVLQKNENLVESQKSSSKNETVEYLKNYEIINDEQYSSDSTLKDENVTKPTNTYSDHPLHQATKIDETSNSSDQMSHTERETSHIIDQNSAEEFYESRTLSRHDSVSSMTSIFETLSQRSSSLSRSSSTHRASSHRQQSSTSSSKLEKVQLKETHTATSLSSKFEKKENKESTIYRGNVNSLKRNFLKS